MHVCVQLVFVLGVEVKGRREMEQRNRKSALKNRIHSGKLTKDDVARRLAELAFGKANDCVRLIMEDSAILDSLDLSLLSEVKRNEKGTVEIRLVDRLKALEQLAILAEQNDSDLESFLKALQGSEEQQ